MFCAQYIATIELTIGDEVKPLPCRTWECEFCGPHRKRQLIAQAIAGRPNKMLTLTVSTKVGISAEDRRKRLHNAWITLKKRMERKLKTTSIHYMAFIEKTQQGEPHLHILLQCGYIHFKWYRKQMRELLESPVLWIEKIRDSKKAAYYVTKYCSKAPAQFGKLKRYWQSLNYDPLRKQKKEEYKGRLREAQVVKRSWQELIYTRKRWGWIMEELPNYWVRCTRPSHCRWNGHHWMPTEGQLGYPDLTVPF